MRNFNRNDRSGNRSEFGKPEMHPAVCANCGKNCQVPFKPTGEKPVYCSDCFETKGGGDTNRSGNRDYPRRDFDRRDSGRRDFRDNDRERREMFNAVCDQCGRNCQVPFKPTGERPTLCDDCFKGGNKRSQSNPQQSNAVKVSTGITKEQFDSLNRKLDKILSLLTPVSEPATEPQPLSVLEASDIFQDDVEIEKPTAPKKAPAKKKVAAKKETDD